MNPFNRKPRCYCARGMTGLIASEVVEQARKDKDFLEKCGFEVLCPVTSEGVKASNKPIQSTKKKMDIYWSRDKEMIRQADVIFNMSPHLPSLGVIREYGYARYCLWKKVLSVFPEGKLPTPGSISYYEDDFVTDSLVLAIGEALRTHRMFWDRIKWRASIINRCLFKWVKHQLQEWK